MRLSSQRRRANPICKKALEIAAAGAHNTHPKLSGSLPLGIHF